MERWNIEYIYIYIYLVIKLYTNHNVRKLFLRQILNSIKPFSFIGIFYDVRHNYNADQVLILHLVSSHPLNVSFRLASALENSSMPFVG